MPLWFREFIFRSHTEAEFRLNREYALTPGDNNYQTIRLPCASADDFGANKCREFLSLTWLPKKRKSVRMDNCNWLGFFHCLNLQNLGLTILGPGKKKLVQSCISSFDCAVFFHSGRICRALRVIVTLGDQWFSLACFGKNADTNAQSCVLCCYQKFLSYNSCLTTILACHVQNSKITQTFPHFRPRFWLADRIVYLHVSPCSTDMNLGLHAELATVNHNGTHFSQC